MFIKAVMNLILEQAIVVVRCGYAWMHSDPEMLSILTWSHQNTKELLKSYFLDYNSQNPMPAVILWDWLS